MNSLFNISKIKGVLVLLILFFQIHKSIGQKKYLENDFILKWNPIALIDHFPAMELGGEYFLTDKVGVQLKFSQKTNWINLNDPYSTKGMRLSGRFNII